MVGGTAVVILEKTLALSDINVGHVNVGHVNVGHVYVISNLRAFGEDVFKVGLTRRLWPISDLMA